MIKDLKGSPMSFEDIENLLYGDSQRYDFIGPPAPISDPRMCAGLLFERWNDASTRSVSFRHGEWPIITIRTDRDFADSSYKHFPVRREAVQSLIDEGILCGTPHMGYTDMKELRLSKPGKKIVVMEWFTKGQAFTDVFCAGASMDGTTGTLDWA